MIRQLRIFTWNVHSSYLYYLSKGEYKIYIPVDESKGEGYHGKGETFRFGSNVIEVPAKEVNSLTLDCILFQSNKNYIVDQFEILNEQQRQLPKVYLEHDPPVHHPSDTKHIIQDGEVIMVHVTHFNRLMWDNGHNEAYVIEKGVEDQGYLYTGELAKGVVVINHLHERGRKLGADIFDKVREEIPLDLVGAGSEEYGGLGEVPHPELRELTRKYRFFFNPVRYTSFSLAICEALMAGLPVVALATGENVTVIENGVSGFIHTDVDYLIQTMKLLLEDRKFAETIGLYGRQIVNDKFGLQRFTAEWKNLFEMAVSNSKNRYGQRSVY